MYQIKSKIMVCALSTVTLFGHHLLASEDVTVSSVNKNTKPGQHSMCTDITLKNSCNGTICTTTSGARFKKVEGGIQLVETGLTLAIDFKSSIDHFDAETYCLHRGIRLPTKDEYIKLVESGFSEAFSGDVLHKMLWSSTVHDRFSELAYQYNGYLNKIKNEEPEYRESNYEQDTARCVIAE